MNPLSPPLGIRAHIERHDPTPFGRGSKPRRWRWPDVVVVFDSETTTDPTQRLLYGAFRVLRRVGDEYRVTHEGLIHADDLGKRDPEGYDVLADFARTHRPDVDSSVEGAYDDMILCSRADFVEYILYRYVYRARGLLVGFNLPFDISRIAVRARRGRDRFRDGFSFVMRQAVDADGKIVDDEKRPCIRVKSLTNASAFIEFTSPRMGEVEAQHARQDEPRSKPHPEAQPMKRSKWTDRYYFKGHFLDLRTLLFALTDRKYSLDGGAEEFLGERKATVAEHGRITPQHVAYGRRDVLLTHRLFEYARGEFDRLPIRLDPCKAYSPASIAKAHLSAMGIQSPRAKWGAEEPLDLYGATMSAYYGGRAGVFARHEPLNVVYCDFQSMYPTTFTLLKLARWLTAESYVVEDCTAFARDLLARISVDDCFDPATWPDLAFFAEIEPADDLLPARFPFDDPAQHFGIGRSLLSALFPMTYPAPDLVETVLRNKRLPNVRRAFRIVPTGTQPGLVPITLSSGVIVDPRERDFFKTIVEQRLRLKRESSAEARRAVRALKIIANSGTYGIFAEVRPDTMPEPEAVSVHSALGTFQTSSRLPEEPGHFYCPPLAALVTSAARLLLSLGEHLVRERGGAIAMCDTDSLAIIASREGRSLSMTRDDGQPLRELSYDEVRAISDRFRTLSPYDPDTVRSSILDITEHNFDGERQRQLRFLGVSAKRYVLYVREGDRVKLVKPSAHGLGQYMNPLAPADDDEEVDRDKVSPWIETLWRRHIHRAEGLEEVPLPFEDLPALTRISITSPLLLEPFAARESGVAYDDAMKPFNFLLSANRLPSVLLPEGADPHRFHLVCAFESQRDAWLRGPWFDIHSGKEWRVTTSLTPDPRREVALRTYGYVADAHYYHPESKCAAADGLPCDARTKGMLGPRRIKAYSYRLLGKEANKLTTVEQGLEHRYEEVQAIYADPSRNDFHIEYGAQLRAVRPRARLARAAKVSERAIRDILSGASTPRPTVQRRLIDFLRKERDRRAQQATRKRRSAKRRRRR